MFDQWKVLHLDEVEAESNSFCRALAQEHFAGHCESVRSFGEARLYLERGLYTPRLLSRPDIIVINWHPDCDAHVLELVHWVRLQPQLQATPVIVFVQGPESFAAQESAREEGITELIVRPPTFEELLPQVRALLERCASRSVVR
jgi:DNA-binding response OmpR family regulator